MESVADMDISGYSWLLVGGMSGPTWQEHRMNLDWAAEVRELAQKQPGTAFFFKQCSAAQAERGIDGLGRHLKLQQGELPVLFRAIPETLLPVLPLSVEKGHRITEAEWNEYTSWEATTSNGAIKAVHDRDHSHQGE